jgi:hypothetical protein
VEGGVLNEKKRWRAVKGANVEFNNPNKKEMKQIDRDETRRAMLMEVGYSR